MFRKSWHVPGLFCVLYFAFALGLRLIVAIAKHNRRTNKRILFADFAFEEAFVGPMEQTEVAAVDDEPRWTGVGLDDVFEFWAGVFEASGDMLDDSFA